MAGKSRIEWTDATWNPIRARNKATGGIGHFCIHASEGCRNCYAERRQPRFRNPVRYAAQDADKVELFLDERELTAPLRWRKPRKVFVCSMTDLFGNWAPDEWIDRVFAVMGACDDAGLEHEFQVLTKRSDRMCRYVTERARIAWNSRRLGSTVFPARNVWLGVSAEDQATANERIPELLATPAVVRFISAEPLLGPVDLTRIEVPRRYGSFLFDSLRGAGRTHLGEPFSSSKDGRTLDWVIVGGESGPGARPTHPDWARSLRDQCEAAGVPFFFKQWGEYAPALLARAGWYLYANGDFSPNVDFRFPDSLPALRVGKKAAGRALDDREHNALPPTA